MIEDSQQEDISAIFKIYPRIVALRWLLHKNQFEFLVEDVGVVSKEDFAPDSKEFAEIDRIEKKWAQEKRPDLYFRFNRPN